MDYTREQLKEIFKGLPEDLREAIVSFETVDAVNEIGDKYDLHIDQVGTLGDEVGRVMIGVSSFKDFTVRLKEKLNIDSEKAQTIAHDVNVNIFLKIREILKKNQLNDILADAPEVPANEIPQTSPKPTTESLFDQKMGALYNLPKEDVEIKEGKKEEKRPFDPYREIV